MKQPQSVEAAACAAARRAAGVVLLVLLALAGTALSPGATAAGAAETRTPASASADPAGGCPHEEADTGATPWGRVRPAAPGAGAGAGGATRPGDATPYRPVVARPVQLPLPPCAARCVVLRC